MARVVVTFRILPEDADIDLHALVNDVVEQIRTFTKDPRVETKHELKPVAFGLQALELRFVMEESRGSTEVLEQHIAKISGVKSVEVSDIRRAVG